MYKTKLPSTRLSLTFEFDLPAVVANPSAAAHDAACKRAAELSGLLPASVVAATAASRNDLSIATAHHTDFDPAFHVADGGPCLRYDFLYDSHVPKLCVRVVSSLGEGPSAMIDGITASRLAFYTMEVLEGATTLSKGSPAARETTRVPLRFGPRQCLNFLREGPGACLRVLYAYVQLIICSMLGKWFGVSQPADVTLVNDAASHIRFYASSRASEPAVMQVFRAPADLAKPFRAFLALAEAWRVACKLRGFFYLMSFSPLVACGVTTDCTDITSRERRYRGAWTPPGPGPSPKMWRLGNIANASLLIVNNYDKHEHSFAARPVAFVWDWLEFAAPGCALGCISINGVFLCFTRGMPSQLQRGTPDFASVMGTPRAQFSQNTKWFSTMGLPASLAGGQKARAASLAPPDSLPAKLIRSASSGSKLLGSAAELVASSG